MTSLLSRVKNLRSLTIRDLTVTFSAGLLLCVMAGAGQSEPAQPDSAAASEEVALAEDAEPDAAADVDLEMGKALFRGLCSGCHGGAGRGGKGPNLTDDRWLYGDKDSDIQRTIENGVPGTTMKKLGESLKEDQIRHIIGYIRSLAQAPGDDDWEPYIAGDPQKGKVLFFDKQGKANCANCHTTAMNEPTSP